MSFHLDPPPGFSGQRDDLLITRYRRGEKQVWRDEESSRWVRPEREDCGASGFASNASRFRKRQDSPSTASPG